MPEFFELVELAPGVHAAVADITGGAVGNAAIIDTGDRTVVVDSFITAQAARELHSEARRLTGRSAFLLVNTHWHSDHTWGNQEFPGIPIVATARTVELMIADTPEDLVTWEAEIDGYLADIQRKLDSDDPAEREHAARRRIGMQHLKAAAPALRITLPNLLIDDRLVIPGARTIELLTFGGGHTDSDVFAWLPQDRIVIAGDLCWNRIHPRTHDGHPGAWADILDRIAALGAQQIHPGHGRPGGPEIAQVLAPYLRTVAGHVADVRRGGHVADLPLPAGSEAWDGEARLRSGITTLAARPDPSSDPIA